MKRDLGHILVHRYPTTSRAKALALGEIKRRSMALLRNIPCLVGASRSLSTNIIF